VKDTGMSGTKVSLPNNERAKRSRYISMKDPESVYKYLRTSSKTSKIYTYKGYNL
jgi:hypothetical protein